jgi:hypothetical protein
MQLTPLLLATIPAVTSVWKLTLYDQERWKSSIHSFSGRADHHCVDFPANVRNRASSLK